MHDPSITLSPPIILAKPAERWARKAAGPRFLREETDVFPKDPKIAVLPKRYLILIRESR